MNSNRIYSFPPIVDGNCRILVLGTMPGAESLRQQRYYAYGRNHFWRIVFALYYIEQLPAYGERVRFLLDKGIALWDVLASCERRSSADAEIKAPEPNSIVELLDEYPKIGSVFLNGKGAAKLFKKLVLPRLNRSVRLAVLPSTSPAYAIPFEEKLEGWKRLHFMDGTI